MLLILFSGLDDGELCEFVLDVEGVALFGEFSAVEGGDVCVGLVEVEVFGLV